MSSFGVLAQLVEQAAVNRWVLGPSPSSGAFLFLALAFLALAFLALIVKIGLNLPFLFQNIAPGAIILLN